MTLDENAEDLAADLGVDEAKVRRKLENLAEYNVPLDEAVQSVRREYAEDDGSGSDVPTRSVAEISTGDDGVSTTVRVLSVGKRSIQYSGERHVIFEGEVADETGKISFTAWEDFDIEPGDSLRIGNAGVREWEGDPELNLGQSTSIEQADPVSVPFDVGGDAALVDLQPGDRGVAVEVEVLECERKRIDGRDGETEILSGILGDESGRLPFTDWEPRDAIEMGATVRIENAFIREFRGVPSVNISEFSRVTPLERAIAVPESAPSYPIGAAIDTGGLFDVELVGNVVAIREGTGLIERCPECGRVTQNGQCRSHGAVDGQEDLRVKAILDDGTGTVTVVLDDDLTADVYGGGLEAAREHARDAMDRDVVAETIRENVGGREFRARGTLSVDDFGANLEADTFEECTDDPADRAAGLLAEVQQ